MILGYLCVANEQFAIEERLDVFGEDTGLDVGRLLELAVTQRVALLEEQQKCHLRNKISFNI